MQFRMGVNLGDVIAGDGTIHGEGVNVAARLEKLAEPGGVCLGHAIHDQVRGKLPYTFADLGEQRLHNIPEPVRAYRVMSSASASAPSAKSSSRDMPLRDKPSIAVLPFTNMSGDPEQEYFSDGITEDIITELSRFRFLFVIARNTSFTFKGRAVDVGNVGRELGVRYVVEGSVRRAGNRVRVTAQLIDAQDGHHIWAERYDRDLADVFAVQDEITRHIVVNVAPRLMSQDLQHARRKPPADMRAYDYYLKAKPIIDLPTELEDLLQARAYCDAAMAIDPAFARAYSYKALSYTIGAAMLETDDIAVHMRSALQCAERAVALDDNDSVSHWALAEAALRNRQNERALTHMRKSLQLNPNDADALAVSGYINAFIGDAALGLRQLDMALERNPSDPVWYHWMRGIALSSLGRYEEALAELAAVNMKNLSITRWRAYVLVRMGQLEEARSEVSALLAARPDLNASKLSALIDYLPNHQEMIDCLRQAGLPD
jgi:adenylate cyclase